MQLSFTLSEPVLRLAAFAGVLTLMAVLEHVIPKRALTHDKVRRWTTNLGVIGSGIAVVRGLAFLSQAVAVPLVAVAAADFAGAHGWGLFNLVDLPAWIEISVSAVILDFAIWLQHVLSHKIPLLWRVHQVHHADVDIDVTTALRFHPVEIGLSMFYKVLWVFLLGPSAFAVLLFEIILNASAMFNHSNVDLPPRLDRVLRAIVVTPDMHRVHHSTIGAEHDSNFGFSLSLWDRLFKTYTAQPAAGHRGMTIGLPQFQNSNPTQFLWSMKQPFGRR